MRKLRSPLYLLCLVLLIPVVMHARRILPLDTRPLVAEKYAGWSGVLSLWVFEGWPCGSGSISNWLNPCVTAFEKAHSGVYIQPQYVDADAIATMGESGILPPDMLMFPPNLLATPEGLLPLTVPDGIRPTLRRSGEWSGSVFATPVALGGYLWAWNSAMIDDLPDTWRNADITLSVPAPQPWRRWDAALLALCSGRYSVSSEQEAPDALTPPPFEVELGLADGETPVPTASPEPRQDATLFRQLPSGFQYDDDAWRHFINGESTAMPVTQREIRKLQTLSNQGKGPDWKLCPGDSAFTDQLLCLALVDRPDDMPRRELCREFLAWLLSDECQSILYRAGAFAVTDSTSGYDPSDPLASMDAALRDPTLCVPRIFDRQWTEQAEGIVRKFTCGTGDTPALWADLRNILAGNTNN